MIVFIDPVCPRSYDRATLLNEALGGTEASVVRVAEAIDARVAQHNRERPEGRYIPASSLDSVDATAIITLRDAHALLDWATRMPKAVPFLWLHDLVLPGTEAETSLRQAAPALAEIGATIVCVSDYHRHQVECALEGRAPVPVVRVYNPIDDNLGPADTTDVDPDLLVFLSSPHKGLPLCLELFRSIRRRWPGMRMLVANPGYMRYEIAQPGVTWLGPLPHTSAMRLAQQALAVLSPNLVYPETFGLVLAESNAVGTPVLAPPIGAAPEVLGGDERQLVPASWSLQVTRGLASVPHLGRVSYLVGARAGAFREYERRLGDWRAGSRPTVAARSAFRLSVVAAEWRRMLGGEPAPAPS